MVEHHQTCLTSKFKTNISWLFCFGVNLRQRFQSETYELFSNTITLYVLEKDYSSSIMKVRSSFEALRRTSAAMSKIHVQNPNTAEDFVAAAAKYDRFRRKAKNFAAYVR